MRSYSIFWLHYRRHSGFLEPTGYPASRGLLPLPNLRPTAKPQSMYLEAANVEWIFPQEKSTLGNI
jgi:hypothetical protein